MAVGESHFPVMHRVAGIRLGTACGGIKQKKRDDLAIIEMAPGSVCSAVFTRNAFCAAPILIARENLNGHPRWLLINSGNANAGTGQQGLQDARLTCRLLAALVDGKREQVLPFSTGVIGERLPVEKVQAALPTALEGLSETNWAKAARAIMTTDTRPKGASKRIRLGDSTVTISGIAKGAGMIQPNMATLLAFIATDAAVEKDALQTCLRQAADRSFNCITVDGDTSTNDACVLMATGQAGNPPVHRQNEAYPAFAEAVQSICQELAEAIVRDGEGASKLMRIEVMEAASEAEAQRVAKTIAHSPLVKTAFFAADPNWGRILAAVGRAECDHLDIAKVSIWLDEVCIVRNGERDSAYTEAAGKAVMAREDIAIRISLGRGGAKQRVLTCDLSYEYVRINAEYRT